MNKKHLLHPWQQGSARQPLDDARATCGFSQVPPAPRKQPTMVHSEFARAFPYPHWRTDWPPHFGPEA